MTRLTPKSGKVIRCTATVYRRREIVVELQSHCMLLRLLGTRTRYALPYDAAYETAGKLLARQQRMETAKARAENKTRARRIR